MKVPLLNVFLDERFLMHRLRSSSIGGICGAVVAGGLFEYRYFAHHVWSWDLLAVVLTIAGVKMTMMLWYRLKD